MQVSVEFIQHRRATGRWSPELQHLEGQHAWATPNTSSASWMWRMGRAAAHIVHACARPCSTWGATTCSATLQAWGKSSRRRCVIVVAVLSGDGPPGYPCARCGARSTPAVPAPLSLLSPFPLSGQGQIELRLQLRGAALIAIPQAAPGERSALGAWRALADGRVRARLLAVAGLGQSLEKPSRVLLECPHLVPACHCPLPPNHPFPPFPPTTLSSLQTRAQGEMQLHRCGAPRLPRRRAATGPGLPCGAARAAVPLVERQVSGVFCSCVCVCEGCVCA